MTATTRYGHELVFGAMVEAPAARPLEVLSVAAVMEEAGLDVIALPDHPYWTHRLDTFAVMAAVLARTSRITVMANLANLPLRPPPVLARTAATLDLLSGGRFELGVGTGAQQLWSSILAEGGPQRDAKQSVDALVEAVEIIRALWTSEAPVDREGVHYRVAGAAPGPAPAHEIPIWFGAYQPRMLRLTGALADAWIPSSPGMPPERLPEANRIIDDAALAAGRKPEDIRRGLNVEGEFSTDVSYSPGEPLLRGAPSRAWAEQLADLALSHGISSFFLYRVESADLLRRFAAEVVPAVREMVAAH
jgi:alkanesulfonate monooxygenase SsuD/methylene tetrahydromethanopterin reductase-like flavin-dependent oxidoreductase (luciferase family)